MINACFTELIAARRLGDDDFRAEPIGHGFLFGGLTMAMALTAAAATVDDGLVPLSLRCSFLSFGEWGPTNVSVDRVNTSRSFATRRVDLRQDGDKRVAVSDLLFHRPEAGTDLHYAVAPRVAAPNDLEPIQVLFGSVESGVDPFEVRPAHQRQLSERERFHPFWARTTERLPDRAAVHCAALAFMSDYLVIRSPFEPGAGQSRGLRSFTLEHTLWFHRPFDAGAWMLFDSSPISESNGRYVSDGTVHDEAGALLASFVQAGFVRPARS